MPKIARLGDNSTHQGQMVTATSNYIAHGSRGCVSGDTHLCPRHGPTPVTASSNIISNGKAILRVGDVAGCGAVIISGDAQTEATH